MDKFYGINRATVTSVNVKGEVVSEKAEPQASEKPVKKSRRAVTFARYIVCVLLVGVCALGHFGIFNEAKDASEFIKTQLSRDIISELSGDK